MRLTTRGRYAVAAMLDLAMQPYQKAITLAEISQRQHISVAYLEQLFSKLKKRGLVHSVRGANGGYHLSKPSQEINVLAVIAAVDEHVEATRCEGKGNCQNGSRCITHDLWQDLSNQIENYLSSITLQQVIDRLGDSSNVSQIVNILPKVNNA